MPRVSLAHAVDVHQSCEPRPSARVAKRMSQSVLAQARGGLSLFSNLQLSASRQNPRTSRPNRAARLRQLVRDAATGVQVGDVHNLLVAIAVTVTKQAMV